MSDALVGAGLFGVFILGGGWMRLYWSIIDPKLRAGLGKLLGVTIDLNEASAWSMRNKSDYAWQGIILFPLYIIVMLFAALTPLFVMIAILIGISQQGT